MHRTSRPFFIVARVGDRSLHRHWLIDGERNFDLHLSYYGDEAGKFAADADYWRECKGPKWPILGEHVREDASIFEAYHAVWFPDDDLLMNAGAISRMFDASRFLASSSDSQHCLTTHTIRTPFYYVMSVIL